MENEKNIEMTTNNTTKDPDFIQYEFPDELKPVVSNAAEMYVVIKAELIEPDKEWLSTDGRQSLLIGLKLDLLYLITFLAVMSGSPDQYSLFLADGLFRGDPPSDYAEGFLKLAENLGINHLIENYKVTDEDAKKFDKFTQTPTRILKALPELKDKFNISMICYLYSSLLASICKLMETHAYSPIIYIGINNYLATQFRICEENMSQRELDQYGETVFPFLKRINEKVETLEKASREIGGEK